MTAPAYVLGLNGKLYRNSGSYDTPTFTEVKNTTDVTLTLEAGEADVTTRANGGWEAIVAALKKGTVEFDMVWDPTDANFTAIKTAFLAGTGIEFFILDGSNLVEGSQGLRATFAILKFTRTEPLAEAMKAAVSMKPTYAEHAPEWYEAPDPTP